MTQNEQPDERDEQPNEQPDGGKAEMSKYDEHVSIVGKDVGRVDSEFDKILQESEQDMVRQLDLWAQQTQQTNEADRCREQAVTEHKLQESRKKDQRMLDRLGFFGRTLVDKYACEFTTAQEVFFKKGHKPRWAVTACVVLRDNGKCVVCNEKIGDRWKVKRILPKELGGKWDELNCVCVCQACAECWYPHRLFDRGLGRQDMLQALCVAVLERRAREYKGCKPLTEHARARLKEMCKVVEYRNAQVTKQALEMQLVRA